MKIVSLLENIKTPGVKAKHGLSLYIETENHKILFDCGPDNKFIQNAKVKNIDLTKVDIVIISHGHIDHGGGLKAFMEINKTAKIYIQRKAFEKYYTKVLCFDFSVSLKVKPNSQYVLLDGNYIIDNDLRLFVTPLGENISPMNNSLLMENKLLDNFEHEQNLIINENNKKVLFMGCGHKGVINILKCAKENIDYCIGGFHLCNPVSKKRVSDEYLDRLINDLKQYKTIFYTCHCTGEYCYRYLRDKNPNINYLKCGEEIVL